jgi:hypothetical protein
METDAPKMLPDKSGKREEELQKILGKHPATADNVYLLTLQLHELLKGYREYVRYFEALFTLPSDREQERDKLLDILIGIKVLLDDMQYHISELTSEIDKFTDALEPHP